MSKKLHGDAKAAANKFAVVHAAREVSNNPRAYVRIIERAVSKGLIAESALDPEEINEVLEMCLRQDAVDLASRQLGNLANAREAVGEVVRSLKSVLEGDRAASK